MKSGAVFYLSALALLIVATFALATATTVIHEGGHYVTGRLLGCSNVEIVLLDEKFETYTKMNCDPAIPDYEMNMLMLSGLLFIIPAAALLYIVRRDFFLSALLFGFNLVISFSDFASFGTAQYTLFFAGAAFVIYGETILADRYVKNAETVITSYSQSR